MLYYRYVWQLFSDPSSDNNFETATLLIEETQKLINSSYLEIRLQLKKKPLDMSGQTYFTLMYMKYKQISAWKHWKF